MFSMVVCKVPTTAPTAAGKMSFLIPMINVGGMDLATTTDMGSMTRTDAAGSTPTADSPGGIGASYTLVFGAD